MDWDDVVLHPLTLRQVPEIENCIKHNDALLCQSGMAKRINPQLSHAVLCAARYWQDSYGNPTTHAVKLHVTLGS